MPKCREKFCPKLIYVLKLEQCKYYVGETFDFNTRFNQHVMGKGAKWTAKYPPTGQCWVHLEGNFFNPYDLKYVTEVNLTWHYMTKVGFDNVRGGPWTNTAPMTRMPRQPPSVIYTSRPNPYPRYTSKNV
jgi:hypothetical protein